MSNLSRKPYLTDLEVTHDVPGQVKVKITAFETCSHFGSWRLLESLEWTNFLSNYWPLVFDDPPVYAEDTY